ncbi:glycine betaine ABC transporter substrate-binding protein [Texcoconibacillus texcoconensis]|uniref:Glycine betaine/proline transport system substrate-binding protein n=1 Tax=Texcoconibacillus texcoconensis TaxID=1095777 RepID=A0A840QLT8_9BACI|nr:glycine betaine ABC transporter substrate-binding protein [Texcoconibacillus texcoconensis]MBB5172334.1 glycine betaine/proline transport system substrate-binding protein [Texcoconibacillus texcoconensis]
MNLIALKQRTKTVLSLTALTGVVMLSACGAEEGSGEEGTSDSEEKPTITLGEVPYDQALPLLAIIESIAEELGYPTEIMEGDVGVMYTGIARGDVDVYADMWLPTLHASYLDQYEDSIELLGTLYENADTGWAVPEYMEDINSIEDLKGNEDMFDYEVVGIEPGAGMMPVSEEVIEEYDLDLELVSASTEAMLAEVSRLTANEEPVVFLAWRPHSMFQLFDIKMLDDPNDIWEKDDVVTGVGADFEEKAPDLHGFLEDFEISIEDVEEMMVSMEDEELDDLADEWIEDNREDVDEWLES